MASDCHDVKHRVPRLDDAYGVLSEKNGEGTMAGLFRANPGAVLRGEMVSSIRDEWHPRRESGISCGREPLVGAIDRMAHVR